MNVGYPLFAVRFADTDRLIVAGGGGEGRHGVKNAVAVFALTGTDATPVLQSVSERELPGDEDAPMSVTFLGTDWLVLGVNRGAQLRAAHRNTHLRVLDAETLAESSAYGFLPPLDQDLYQRAAAASQRHVAVVGAGGRKGALAVATVAGGEGSEGDDGAGASTSPPALALAWTRSFDEDPSDASFSEDGTFLAVPTPNSLLVFKAADGKLLHELPAGGSGGVLKWARARFVSPTRLVAVAHARTEGRAELVVFELDGERRHEVHRSRIAGTKAVSALDATAKHIAVGTPGGDIYLFSRRLALLARVRGAHDLPVTDLAISPDSASVVSVSVGGSIHALRVPLTASADWLSMATVGWTLLSALVVALIAWLVSLLVEQDMVGHGQLAGLVAGLSPQVFPSVLVKRFSQVYYGSDTVTSIESSAGTLATQGMEQPETPDATSVSTFVPAETTPAASAEGIKAYPEEDVEDEAPLTPEPAASPVPEL